MRHWKQYFDSDYLRAFDLIADDGRPLSATVTIDQVEYGKVNKPGGAQKGQMMMSFVGRKKKYLPCKTVCDTIGNLYGHEHPDKNWPGKRVTLFATKCEGKGKKLVDCIRVRPEIPPEKARDSAEVLPQPAFVAELTGEATDKLQAEGKA